MNRPLAPRVTGHAREPGPAGWLRPGGPGRVDTAQRRRPRGFSTPFRRRALPRPVTTLAAGAGVIASLAPGLLPRTAVTQAVLTAFLVAVALGGTALARTVRRRSAPGRTAPRRLRPPGSLRTPATGIPSEDGIRRRLTVFGTAAAVLAALLAATHWQNTLRAAMDTPALTVAHWPAWAAITAILLATPLLAARAFTAAVRILRGTPLRTATAALALGVLGASLPGLTPATEHRAIGPSTATADGNPGATLPYTRSGSRHSPVPWETLGVQGRRFVAQGRADAVRVYIGLDTAAALADRVALALRELDRTGGFARGHLVLTVPTGSGWIDAEAAAGLESRFGGDVALVGLQYTAAPSWVTFVAGRDQAVGSARALFAALERRLATMAAPPKLYVYGQSLGALGGSAIFAGDAEQASRTCAVLWAGPPAGAVHRAGATVLANRSDPVVHWSPRLLWQAPDLAGTRPDAPVPPWLPVLSFLQVSADLLGALDAPAGHGHRYGADQGTALGGC